MKLSRKQVDNNEREIICFVKKDSGLNKLFMLYQSYLSYEGVEVSIILIKKKIRVLCFSALIVKEMFDLLYFIAVT